jgi:hypothetical protein
MKNKRKWALLFGLVFILALTACGGGGASSDGTNSTPQGSTGTVAVMLTDSPVDDYDHIWIDIARAELLPENGGNPVVIFNPDQPVRFDLLSLRTEDEADGGALLTMADVPVGVYGKIRLEIAENQGSASAEAHVVVGETVVDGVSTFEYFKLPSGKIDLNFRGGVTVVVGSTIVVSVDIDCEKSIHISGNHKNFRPVVFVNVELVGAFQLCPRVLHGTVESLVLDEDDETVVGFDLAIPHSNISVPVLVDADTGYIDADGNSADAQTLEVGDAVHVRGRLQEGGLLASMVVIGDVDLFTGEVTQAVTGDQFAMDLDIDQNEERTIILRNETLILWACDLQPDRNLIQPGMRARVFGKEQADGSIVAVAVLLRPQILSGELTAVTPTTGGHDLTINASSTPYFLPILAPIHVQFDGFLTPAQLAEMVACRVEAGIPPLNVNLGITPTGIAGWVTVLPDALNTMVNAIDLDTRLLETLDGTVHVQTLAQAADLRPGALPPTFLNAIEPGDTLLLYGLATCPAEMDDAVFEASVVLIVPPESME